jgi:anti-anti-sigma factor
VGTTNFEASRRPDGVLEVRGELDHASVPVLVALLDPVTTVRLDLSGVTFMDSTGLHALVDQQARLGERFRIVAIAPVVRRLFELTSLTSLLLPPSSESS